MKIAELKQTMREGDTATIKGKVMVVYAPKQRGTFQVQSSLVVDGPQTPGKENSIFCEFAPDISNLKGKEVEIQGTVNVYNGQTKLQRCKVCTTVDAPQQQSTPPQQQDQKLDWDKIAEGKVLHGVVCAAIQSGQMKCENLDHIRSWVNLIMGRDKKPAAEPPQNQPPTSPPDNEYPRDAYEHEEPPF